MSRIPSVDLVLAEMTRHGHVVFHGDYDLNIVGLRSTPGQVNVFDDYICIFYKLQNVWQFHCWAATTDPGLYWLKNPSVVAGTAILQPGQYRSCWTLSLHKGAYEALVQTGMPWKVWRDRDRDSVLDYIGPTYSDATGVNMHHAGAHSTLVDAWTAGCQVISRLEDWEVALDLVKKQIVHGHGNKFSYTLLNWS